MESVVCHADPLLIVHREDGIQFCGRMDFEFTGTLKDGETGRAVCLQSARQGWTPVLNVQYQTRYRGFISYRGVYRRKGVSFVGEDDEGMPFTWYIDGFADDYIISLRSGVVPEELPFESLEDELA